MKWIKIEERMPTKEDAYNVIAWWNRYDCAAHVGEYYRYDGAWIAIESKRWRIEMPLSEFTHWAIIEKPEGVE